MSEKLPRKCSLDSSSVEQLRKFMHAVECLTAETDYIRLKLADYRQLDVARMDLQAGADSLNDAADYLRDVLYDLSERIDSISTLNRN